MSRTLQRLHLVPVLFVALLSVALVGCADTESAEEAAAEAEAEVVELRSALGSSLERAETQLAEIEARIDEAGDEADPALVTAYENIMQEYNAIETELNEMQYESALVFEETEDKLQRQMNQLEADIVRAELLMADSREDFLEVLDARMADMDQQLEAVEAELDEAAMDVQTEYEQALADLRDERAALAAEYQELENASEAEYREMREELATSVSNMHNELHEMARAIDRSVEVEVDAEA